MLMTFPPGRDGRVWHIYDHHWLPTLPCLRHTHHQQHRKERKEKGNQRSLSICIAPLVGSDGSYALVCEMCHTYLAVPTFFMRFVMRLCSSREPISASNFHFVSLECEELCRSDCLSVCLSVCWCVRDTCVKKMSD